MPEAMTTAEVMAALKLKDPDAVYALQKAGRIRGGKLRRQWRWSAASIEALVNGEPVPASSPSKPRRASVSKTVAECPDFLGDRARAAAGRGR